MRRRAGLNFAAQSLSLILSFGERLVVVGMLVRAWGAETYAGWAVLLSAAGALGFAELGMNVYFGNLWQAARARGEDAALQRALGLSLSIYLVLGAALAFCCAVALALGAGPSLVRGRLAPDAATVALALLMAASVLRVMRGGFSQLYRGRGEFARGVLIDLAAPAGTFAAGLAVAAFGMSPVVLAACCLLSEAGLGWLLMLVDIRRRYPDLRLAPARPTRAELGALGARLPWLAILQGAPIAILQAPVLALGAGAADALVGFVLARTLVNFARQLVTMMSIAVGVETARRYYGGDARAVNDDLLAFGRLAVAGACICAGAILLLGDPFIALWTGRADLFDPSVALWLAAGAVVASAATPVSTLLTLANEQRPAALALAGQTLAGLGAMALLIPAFGAMGAAAALFFGEIVGAALILRNALTQPGALAIDYRIYGRRCLETAAACSIWVGAVGLAVSNVVDTHSALGFVLAGLLLAAVGAAPALYASLPPARRRQAVEAVRGLL